MTKYSSKRSLRFNGVDFDSLSDYFAVRTNKQVLKDVVIEHRQILASCKDMPAKARVEYLAICLLFATYHKRLFDFDKHSGLKGAYRYIKHLSKEKTRQIRAKAAICFCRLRGKEPSFETLKDAQSPLKMVLYYYKELLELTNRNQSHIEKDKQRAILLFNVFFMMRHELIETAMNFGFLSKFLYVIGRKKEN